MKYFPKVMGEKVYLSPINPEDYEVFTKWMNDSKITDGVNNTSMLISLINEKEWIEKVAKGGETEYTFAIIKKEGDKLLGSICLGEIHPVHRSANFGISIGEIEEHNKGYGTDAIKCILTYGFNTLNLNNIILNVFSFNHNAKKCYEKCGFKIIGERRNAYFCNEEYHNIIIMDITREDWLQLQKNKQTLFHGNFQ